MSKSPDLSAFPIPRKGSARPISMDELPGTNTAPHEREGEGNRPASASTSATQLRNTGSSPDARTNPTPSRQILPPIMAQAQTPTVSGQVVATTVKLDEGRYLRLVNAGQPEPGRLKRRTIQEMMVEAIDEWFGRRGL